MPELPEVETIRAALDPELAGATVTEAWGHPSAKFAQAPAAVGKRFVSVGRRGKYLLADLSSPPDPHGAQRRTSQTEPRPPADSQLIVHLGMTGVLSLRPSRAPGTVGYGAGG
jgi:formamidopyrimidine-DNA glycosylase